MTTDRAVIPYTHVDAFADRPFTGNQAAVMVLDEWLPDDVLQAIGAENNFAETAFVVKDDTDATDYELRWFTPTMEIRLCGHATLASGHVLLKGNVNDRIVFGTRKAGLLEVVRDADAYRVGLPAIHCKERAYPEAVKALGAYCEATLRHDDGYAIFVFADDELVRSLCPDFAALRALGSDVFICTAPGTDTDIVSRVFVPGGGIDEDPVTGGAHACLTPFWAQRLGRAEFTAYQASERGGRLTCRLEGEGNDARVWLGGRCVTVVEGSFYLP